MSARNINRAARSLTSVRYNNNWTVLYTYMKKEQTLIWKIRRRRRKKRRALPPPSLGSSFLSLSAVLIGLWWLGWQREPLKKVEPVWCLFYMCMWTNVHDVTRLFISSFSSFFHSFPSRPSFFFFSSLFSPSGKNVFLFWKNVWIRFSGWRRRWSIPRVFVVWSPHSKTIGCCTIAALCRPKMKDSHPRRPFFSSIRIWCGRQCL